MQRALLPVIRRCATQHTARCTLPPIRLAMAYSSSTANADPVTGLKPEDKTIMQRLAETGMERSHAFTIASATLARELDALKAEAPEGLTREQKTTLEILRASDALHVRFGTDPANTALRQEVETLKAELAAAKAKPNAANEEHVANATVPIQKEVELMRGELAAMNDKFATSMKFVFWVVMIYVAFALTVSIGRILIGVFAAR